MRILLILILVGSACAQTNAMVDSTNLLVDVSSQPKISTDTTLPTTATAAQLNAFVDHGRDQYGRYCCELKAGLVSSVTPRWPSDSALKAQAQKRSLLKLMALVGQRVNIVAWQADPSLLLLMDRTSELAAVDAQIATLKSVLAGP